MDIDEQLRRAVADESELPGEAMLPTRLARACASVLGVDGVGLSLFNGPVRVPMGASDEMATAAERLQFTLGEGPCLAAHRRQESVYADDQVMAELWPVFWQELLQRSEYRGIVSMPLRNGDTGYGAIDFYLVDPDRIGAQDWGSARAAAAMVGHCLSHPARAEWNTDLWAAPPWLDHPEGWLREATWVAIGMITTAAPVTAADALAMLRARAYARQCSVDELAVDLVSEGEDLQAFLGLG